MNYYTMFLKKTYCSNIVVNRKLNKLYIVSNNCSPVQVYLNTQLYDPMDLLKDHLQKIQGHEESCAETARKQLSVVAYQVLQ